MCSSDSFLLGFHRHRVQTRFTLLGQLTPWVRDCIKNFEGTHCHFKVSCVTCEHQSSWTLIFYGCVQCASNPKRPLCYSLLTTALLPPVLNCDTIGLFPLSPSLKCFSRVSVYPRRKHSVIQQKFQTCLATQPRGKKKKLTVRTCQMRCL